jgi:hypothetical protein
MSQDNSEEVSIRDLRPNGGATPEGMTTAQIDVSREDRLEAMTTISQIANMVAVSKGINKAIKDLMLGIEASAMAMAQFTTTAQVANILDQVRESVVEFGAFRDKLDAASESAGAVKH